jgi:hypothetical protein
LIPFSVATMCGPFAVITAVTHLPPASNCTSGFATLTIDPVRPVWSARLSLTLSS